MPEFDVRTPDGDMVTFVKEDGLTFRKEMIERRCPAGDLKLQLQWIKETEIRDDDILICAYPKAGTHWLWEVLSMLQKQKSEYEVKVKETQMLEFCSKEDIVNVSSPRVLNTHVFPRHLPREAMDKKSKIIHVMRNPKDILVSLYYHMQSTASAFGAKPMEFKQFIQPFLGDQNTVVPCSYFTYIKEYEEFRKTNPDQLLHVFYEDMKKCPKVEIKKIAKFIGRSVDDDQVQSIANKCAFVNLKKANDEVKDDFTKSQPKSIKSIMFRKGIIGDWKTHLTVAENEAFDEIIARELTDIDIKFQFE